MADPTPNLDATPSQTPDRRNSSKEQLIFRLILAIIHLLGGLFRKRDPK